MKYFPNINISFSILTPFLFLLIISHEFFLIFYIKKELKATSSSIQTLLDPMYCCSIDHMSEIVRHAIENKMRIKQQLMLKQQDFLLNEVGTTTNTCIGEANNRADPLTWFIAGLDYFFNHFLTPDLLFLRVSHKHLTQYAAIAHSFICLKWYTDCV